MDIRCVVCGEPWDAYGVRHGDMEKWEAELFRAGAGCPCCEGVKPEGGWSPETISDIENGDEDPIDRLHAWEDSQAGKTPSWDKDSAYKVYAARTKDPVTREAYLGLPEDLWQCDGCGVKVQRSNDPDQDEIIYDQDYHKKWYRSHRYSKGCPDEEPAHVFPDGQKACEFCIKICDHCKEAVISHVLSFDDCESGASMDHEGESLCYECYSAICSECGQGPEDVHEAHTESRGLSNLKPCEHCHAGYIYDPATQEWVLPHEETDDEDDSEEEE